MLSGMEESLKGTDLVLSDETYRDLLYVMYDERTRFSYSTDLADSDNYDMSAERLSAENLNLLANNMRDLNNNIIESAKEILSRASSMPSRRAWTPKLSSSLPRLRWRPSSLASSLFGDQRRDAPGSVQNRGRLGMGSKTTERPRGNSGRDSSCWRDR